MKSISDQRAGLFKRNVIVFALTLIVTLYWYLPMLFNVYHFPLVGAIYEILWIFMLAALFTMPVFSFIYWVKNKFNLRSLTFTHLSFHLQVFFFNYKQVIF